MFEKAMNRPSAANHEELVSAFLAVRRSIGLAGLGLPVLLYFQARVIDGGVMQSSISGFYHTTMGDVFVGILVAIGVFLISYVGHLPNEGDRITDWWVSTIGGIAAVGVAIFPTLPEYVSCPSTSPPTIIQGIVIHWCTWWAGIHFLAAAVFYVCMAIFCLLLFPRNKQGEVKYFDEAGNTVYFICGVLLLVAIFGLLIFFFIKETGLGMNLAAKNFVFWFEALGVVAFAVAWLTKGNILAGIGNLLSSNERT